MFIKVVENNTITMNIFKKTNVLMKRADHQIVQLLNYRHDIYSDFESYDVVGKKNIPCHFNFVS
jgi:hypothetical protein